MGVIKVKLPRERSGQEILDAFRAASSFQESPEQRWEAHSYTTHSGVATSENTFSPMRGYYATPAYLHRQSRISRLFRARRGPTWRTVPGFDLYPFWTQIKLEALQPDRRYAEVELAATHLVDTDPLLGLVRIIHDPGAEEFATLRPAYDRIVQEFLQRLERP